VLSQVFTRISLLAARDRVERRTRGQGLARHEGDVRTKAQEPLSLSELLSLLGDAAERDGRSREDAIACYLSGSEGWREAVKLLGGAFAEGEARLRERQSD
jgi:hypothetical protein